MTFLARYRLSIGTIRSMRKVARRSLIALLALAIVGMIWFASVTADRVVAREIVNGKGNVTLLSHSYTIDRLYQSMQGPSGVHQDIRLVEDSRKQLLWVTGIDCRIVGADGEAQRPQDFFCHSNLTFTSAKADAIYQPPGRAHTPDARLFTLVPGRMQIDLPAGFGMPVYSDEALDYLTMSLNLNHRGEPVKLRFRTNVHFVRDEDVRSEPAMKPLFRRALYAYEAIGKESPHSMCMGGDNAGAACGPFIGKAASNSFLASLGKTNTVHWLIPPGHFESRVDVTPQMELPYDTRAHYVTAHLHPYGKSVSLVDKTDAKTLFTVHASDYTDRLGVRAMEQWSSDEGVVLRKDHRYEIVTTYHNPTDKPIDAMSIVYIYALDKTFKQ
jgi:hypothetical protein